MLIQHHCVSWWKFAKLFLAISILFFVIIGSVSSANNADEPMLIVNEIEDVSTDSILIISGTTNLPDETIIRVSIVVGEMSIIHDSSYVENGRFVVTFDIASLHLKPDTYQLKIFDFEKCVYKEEYVTILPKGTPSDTLKVPKGTPLTISGITDLPEDTHVTITVNVNDLHHNSGSYIENGKYSANFDTSHWPLGTYQVRIKDSKYYFYKEEYITVIEPIATFTPEPTITQTMSIIATRTPNPIIQDTPFERRDLSGFNATFTLIAFTSIVMMLKSRKIKL